MNKDFKQQLLERWSLYFPETSLPIGVFYSDDLCDATYAKTPSANSRGYTCIFAQMARVHLGHSLAFDTENLGCFGSMQTLFGGPYHEEKTVKLLCEIEHFKKNREQVNAMHQINPKAEPTGRYIIFKPFDKLTEEDKPAIYCVFAKPDVIAALHGLSCYDDTRVDSVIVPFGAGCEGLISFAFSEAKKSQPRAVIGGMDTAMRNCIKAELLTFSVPSMRFEQMVENMDSSFLNTYIWSGLKPRLMRK